MTEKSLKTQFSNIDLAEWEAAHAPTLKEFPASRFVIIQDGDLVRIAFGHNGAPIDEKGTRATPVYSVAVSMSPVLAAELKDVLNQIIKIQVVRSDENASKH